MEVNKCEDMATLSMANVTWETQIRKRFMIWIMKRQVMTNVKLTKLSQLAM